MNEEWKAIPGYEGLYEVSNCGRVRSLPRIVKACGTSQRRAFGRILKPYNNKLNYQYVALSKDGKPKTYSVHRLVATQFVPNPNNLPIINHKDENPNNNNANKNLTLAGYERWRTYGYSIVRFKTIIILDYTPERRVQIEEQSGIKIEDNISIKTRRTGTVCVNPFEK